MIALVPHRLDLKPHWKTDSGFMWLSPLVVSASGWRVRTVQSGSAGWHCWTLWAPSMSLRLLPQPFSYVLLLQLMRLPLGQVGKPWAGCYGNWWVLLAEGEGKFLELTQKSSGSRFYFSSASGFPACCSWIWFDWGQPFLESLESRIGWCSPEDLQEEGFRGSVWPDCVSSWLLKLCWSHTACLSPLSRNVLQTGEGEPSGQFQGHDLFPFTTTHTKTGGANVKVENGHFSKLVLILSNNEIKIYFIESWVWWFMLLISVLGRQRQLNLWLQGQPGLQRKFPDQSELLYGEILSQRASNKKRRVWDVILGAWLLVGDAPSIFSQPAKGDHKMEFLASCLRLQSSIPFPSLSYDFGWLRKKLSHS